MLTEKTIQTLFGEGINILKISVVITAGGTSNRFGSNKLLENMENEPLICHTIRKFQGLVDEIIVSTTSEISSIIEKYFDNIVFAKNGSYRQASVLNGLLACNNPDYVLIHDGARPFVSKEIILKTIEEVQKKGAVAVGIPAIDTIKICDLNNKVISTPKRERVFYIQTPQAFKYQDILNAHLEFKRELSNFSDDASLMEKMGEDVFIIEGNIINRKVTFKEDLNLKTE